MEYALWHDSLAAQARLFFDPLPFFLEETPVLPSTPFLSDVMSLSSRMHLDKSAIGSTS